MRASGARLLEVLALLTNERAAPHPPWPAYRRRRRRAHSCSTQRRAGNRRAGRAELGIARVPLPRARLVSRREVRDLGALGTAMSARMGRLVRAAALPGRPARMDEGRDRLRASPQTLWTP